MTSCTTPTLPAPSTLWSPPTASTSAVTRLRQSSLLQDVHSHRTNGRRPARNLHELPKHPQFNRQPRRGQRNETRLFRNFAALKEAWTLDAVNNDDESIYDVSSTVVFGRMLGRIGYKYTIAPYTNQRFLGSLSRRS